MNELLQSLAPGGPAREALRPAWGAWADSYCDALLKELQAPRLQDVAHKEGAFFLSYGVRQGEVHLNVRWDANRGWFCYTGADLNQCLVKMREERP